MRRYQLLIICLAIGSTQTAWAIVVPVLPAYVERFGASGFELGLVVAMFGIGRLIANFPAGMLAQRVHPGILLLIGMLGVVSTMVATAFVESMQLLLGMRLGTGLAGGLAITAGMIMVAQTTTEKNRGASMSLLHSVQLAGGSSGLMLGGILYTFGGPQAPFLASGVFALLVMSVGTRSLLSHQTLSRETSAGERAGAWATAGSLIRDRRVLAVSGIGFAIFFHRFGGLQSLLPLFAYTAIGLTVAGYGVILGSISLVGLVLALLIGRWSDTHGRRGIMILGMLIAGGGLPVLALTDSPLWFIVVMIVTGLAAGATSPLQSAYLADVTPARAHGPSIGIFRTVGDAAGILGPIVLGLITDVSSMKTAILTLALVMLMAVALFALGTRGRGNTNISENQQ